MRRVWLKGEDDLFERQMRLNILRFFKNRTDPRIAALYADAVRAARAPVLYQRYGVPDTMDGRFDMVVFHIAPIVDRLRDDTGAINPSGQALFDTFITDMEGNLRSIGVGDLSVPKKMQKIGESFYGRFNAYRRVLDDPEALRAAFARNVLDDGARADSPEADALARYYLAIHAAAQAGDPIAHFTFPDPVAFAPDNPQSAASPEADREAKA